MVPLAALLAGGLVVGACGELEPISYTRASTTTTDPAEQFDDVALPEELDEPGLRQARYTVEPGDSLTSIAAQFGVSADVLMAVNHIDDPDLLEAGVTLRIPGPDETIPPPWQQQRNGQ